MRGWVLGSILAAALVSGAGCKNDHDAAKGTASTGQAAPKAQEPDFAFTQVRDRYSADIRSRLDVLDQKLDVLSTRTDAAARDAYVRLRARRDQLAVRLDAASKVASSTWNDFTRDVNGSFEQVERDVNAALK